MAFPVARRPIFIAGLLIGSLVFVFVILRFSPISREKERPEHAIPSINHEMENFFPAFWQRPIPLQGVAPASFTEKEALLTPEACGSCHVQQYADWKESLHSRAMGPGPWGQIIDLTNSSPEEAILCMSCHAPLSEQAPVLEKSSAAREKVHEKNPSFNRELQLRGITCAACHVRQHQRFGPPKSQEAANNYPPGMPNHGGVQRTPYFERAEFCKDCHQFDPENTLLVNGKPLQDTYREWKKSIWGEGQAACQECHMPNRRHLWKGIHDAEWVKNGVRVEARIQKAPSAPGSPLEVGVELTNAAVGHNFPTYITPKVFIRAALLDELEKPLPGTEQEKIVGWDVRFEDGEWKEYFDTRIPPEKSSTATFRWTLPSRAKKIRAWVEVHPDHFYHVHFYPGYLKSPGLSKEGRKLIEEALRESGRTRYLLFEKLLPITRS